MWLLVYLFIMKLKWKPIPKFNPFDTMRFQYFALISTEMRGTHVHLPIKTICGLKLNNRHGLVGSMVWVYCQLPWPNLQLFAFILHDLKVNFLGAKIMTNLSFLTLKNYAIIIYPSLAHLGFCIIELECFELICTHLVHQ